MINQVCRRLAPSGVHVGTWVQPASSTLVISAFAEWRSVPTFDTLSERSGAGAEPAGGELPHSPAEKHVEVLFHVCPPGMCSGSANDVLCGEADVHQAVRPCPADPQLREPTDVMRSQLLIP